MQGYTHGPPVCRAPQLADDFASGMFPPGLTLFDNTLLLLLPPLQRKNDALTDSGRSLANMQSQETPLDVEAILAILSQHANSASTPGVPGPTPQAQSAGAGGLPVGQNDAHASQWGASTTALPVPVPQQSVHDPRLRPQSRTATASPSPTIDPATITTWQEGMRCVTKIIAQNARFGDSIKKVDLRYFPTSCQLGTH